MVTTVTPVFYKCLVGYTQVTRFCPACNQATEIVFVYGHGQCSFCKTNIEPCCTGEKAEREGGSPLNDSVELGRELQN